MNPFMKAAFEEAAKVTAGDGWPFGALIVKERM